VPSDLIRPNASAVPGAPGSGLIAFGTRRQLARCEVLRLKRPVTDLGRRHGAGGNVNTLDLAVLDGPRVDRVTAGQGNSGTRQRAAISAMSATNIAAEGRGYESCACGATSPLYVRSVSTPCDPVAAAGAEA
jgi:hypothetical protein